MSSSDIKALIQTCETEISSLEMEIKQKKRIIEDQEDYATAYQQQGNRNADAYGHDKASYSGVLDETGMALIASQIETKYDDVVSKTGREMQYMDDIVSALHSALLKSCGELEALETALQAKRNQLSNLWSQYESARRHERAREAAAAAAAQQ